MSFLKHVFAFGVFFSVVAVAQGKTKVIGESSEQGARLIELFSSESCSSCPPADQWISDLKKRPELWKDYVPVVFHVDYWNHLGWKDLYSSEEMTRRQKDLTSRWPHPSMYTPSFIVDGQEWKNWGGAPSHLPPRKANLKQPKLLITQEEPGKFSLKISGQNPKVKYVVRMALLGMDLHSNISGGENSGRALKHNFLILEWLSKNFDGKNAAETFNFVNLDKKGKAVAAWIEEEGNPTPLQAVGGNL